MEHEPRTTCDICKTEKREINHWFRYRRSGTRITPGTRITFFPWDDPAASSDDGHVCGQDCAAKMLIRHLDGKASDGTFPDSGNAGEAVV